jgi:hypothetical protein
MKNGVDLKFESYVAFELKGGELAEAQPIYNQTIICSREGMCPLINPYINT